MNIHVTPHLLAARFATGLLCVSLASCTTLTSVPLSGTPPDVSPGDRIVIVAGGSAPRHGCVATGPAANARKLAFAADCGSAVEHIDLHTVEKLERTEFNATRTLLLVAGVLVLIAAAQYGAGTAKLISAAP